MTRKMKLLLMMFQLMFLILFSNHLQFHNLFCSNRGDLDVPIALCRSKRSCLPPNCLIEKCNLIHYALSCAEQVKDASEPATYIEAIDSVDKDKWISAMQEEMQSLEKNGTWEIVSLPKQKKPVAANGSSKERRVYLLVSLQDLR